MVVMHMFLPEEGASGDHLTSTEMQIDTDGGCRVVAEGGMTHGQGMMRFTRAFMAFADGLPLVLAALEAHTPWGLATHTLRSSYLANMFWFCFPPRLRLKAKVLPPMTRLKVIIGFNFFGFLFV
jgi:hypothetical protein